MSPPAALERQRMEAEWRRRAMRLSRRPVAATSSKDRRQVLVVQLGGQSYGIELVNVAEVLPAICCTPVPGAPPALAGVINVHGEIRPVVDLKFLFGIPHPAGPRMPSPVILLRQQGREIGLQVDRVEQVRQVASGDINVGLPTTRYLKGVTPDTLMLLSTEALFTELLKDDFTK